jgi:hypothetical protein
MGDEEQKVSMAERQFALDAEIRRREMSLKENETHVRSLTVAQATVVGAILSLLGGVVGAYVAGKFAYNQAIDLETKKFETTLIFDAIKAPTRADAVKNLRFFVSAGFLSDKDGKIAKLQDDAFPYISAPRPTSAAKAISATGVISLIDEQGNDKGGCTAAAISPHYAITRAECAAPSGADSKMIMTLSINSKLFRPKTVAVDKNNTLALIRVAESEEFIDYLDYNNVREPIVGEAVYFAHFSAGPTSVETTVCNITESGADKDDFVHNCTGGPGSAGAMIIATSDDALLGVHQTRDTSAVKSAIKLSRTIPQFYPFLKD